MDYARIITIGHRRLGESAITLSLSDRLIPQPKITYIISPYSEKKLREFWSGIDLDLSKCKFIQEQEFDRYRPKLPWYRETDLWFYQQALKLSALDILPHDRFLLQDCDCGTVDTYEPWKNGKANIRFELIRANPWIHEYDKMITKFLGITKKNPNITYTAELVPVLKTSWIALRNTIESTYKTDYLTAIADFYKIAKNSPRHLSEFEMLGTWQEYYDGCLQEEQNECLQYNPEKLRYSDFDDIPNFTVLKFRARPMKYIQLDAAADIIKNIRRYIDRNAVA